MLEKNIKKKTENIYYQLFAICTIFVFSILVLISYTISSINDLSVDSARSTIAGRQRYLNQKFVKEVLLSANKIENKNIQDTSSLLLASANVLIEGGEVNKKNIESDEETPVTIAPPPSEELKNDFIEQKQIAIELVAVGKKLSKLSADDASFIEVQSKFLLLEKNLHDKAELTIKKLAHDSNSKLSHMIFQQFLISGFVILAILILVRQMQTITFALDKEIDARLSKEEELQRSNAELEQFASVASHDLQEPLRKVAFFSDLLEKEYSDKLGEEGKEYIDVLKDASGRMSDLIRDLLNLSRVNTKGNPFKETSLSKVVKEIISDLDLRIKDTNATVEIENLPKLKVDDIQIKQLFQNLISNALKYHREGVAPIVKVRTAGNNNGFETIEIQDNGIGIKEEYVEQIFLPFKRLHSKTEFEGTGIGLAICDKIIKRHNGRIKVKSKYNEGTTFIIELPKIR